MTLMDIIIKAALFFAVFYGGILITSLISKKFKKEEDLKD